MPEKKSESNKPRLKERLRAKISHAFKIESAADLTDSEIAVLEKTADFIIKKNMNTPAILFLETLSPLNFIGSQAMVFLQPLLGPLFSEEDYKLLVSALEKRNSISVLVGKIIERDKKLEIDVKKTDEE